MKKYLYQYRDKDGEVKIDEMECYANSRKHASRIIEDWCNRHERFFIGII